VCALRIIFYFGEGHPLWISGIRQRKFGNTFLVGADKLAFRRFLLVEQFLAGVATMPKGKVLHHQRVIGRILRAAEQAHFPVEQIEFCANGTIIVKPGKSSKPDEVSTAVETKNEWDGEYGPPSAA
jgi:hypothetical protein